MKKRKSFWNSRCVQNWICILSMILLLADFAGLIWNCGRNGIHSLEEAAEIAVLDSYEKSDTFLNAFFNEADIRMRVSRAQFIYNDLNVAKNQGKTKVDIGYLDHIAYGDELTGITYYLEDLLNFNWDSSYIDGYFDGEAMYSAVSDVPESLKSHAGTTEQLEEYLSKLERTIYVMQEMNDLHEEPVENYNVQAAAVSMKNGLMYSSISLSEKEAALPFTELNALLSEKVKEKGGYVISQIDGSMETNLDLKTQDIVRYDAGDRLNLLPGDVIYLWVDTGYLKADSLWAGYLRYTDNAGIIRAAFIILGISLLLFMISLIRRIVLESGDGQEKRRIAGWKTEFLFAECIAAGVAAMGMVYSLIEQVSSYGDYGSAWLVIGAGIVLGLMIAAALIINLLYFGMEIIRRLKERAFYKSSLLKCLISAGMKIIRLSGSRIRFTIGYLAFLFFNLFAVMSLQVTGFFFFLMVIADLILGGLILCYLHEQELLRKQMQQIADGEGREKLNIGQFHLTNREMADHINRMDLGIKKAVDISIRDERMKTELITNVSHDIKTPLTSMITYVDLLSKEPLETENEKKYVEVLKQKSNRLKQLIEDLMEASKINSGNITVNPEKLHMKAMIAQVCAEYESKLAERKLFIVTAILEEDLEFTGDSRHTWRVFTNLFGNVCKYALTGTRVYLETGYTTEGNVYLELKNISEQSLNISAEELTERFVRGDESRNTEGNGLGLSIAKSLMQAMGGSMEVTIDGDLFKTRLVFAK